MNRDLVRLRVDALRSLGVSSVARVGVYRALVRLGYYRWRQPVRPSLVGPFLTRPARDDRVWPDGSSGEAWSADARSVLAGEIPAFSSGGVRSSFPPRWNHSLLAPDAAPASGGHWTQLSDFGLPGGDIKGYWESARFDGLIAVALGWLATGEPDCADGLERWLSSFASACPANAGVQWRCGQETSIRLMHTLAVVEILRDRGGWGHTDALVEMVVQHAERISPTMLYAIGQDNNHGTSEAAALYVAGLWLARYAPRRRRRAATWRLRGRRWLVDRATQLIMDDGSFSQHSLTYHRMMLDTMAFVVTMNRLLGGGELPEALLERCRLATDWLERFVDPTTGDGPNLGANDGARLFPFNRCDYRDFRPSVQWASRCFRGRSALGSGPWDETWQWFESASPTNRLTGPTTTAVASPPRQDLGTPLLMPHGGYALLSAGADRAIVRLPRYAFRPSHCDPLHVDLWVNGRNIVCDGGSYSYNTEQRWMAYFPGVEAHNTIQFDGREPMPRVSRFLYAEWLSPSELSADAAANSVTSAYVDHLGATHRRVVTLESGRCEIVDAFSGFTHRAVLRWRLSATARRWRADDDGWTDGSVHLCVGRASSIVRQEMVEGWQSRYYGRMETVDVLEVETDRPTTLTSVFRWQQ